MIVIIENITARYVTASEPFTGGIPPLTAFHGWLHRLIHDCKEQFDMKIDLHGFGIGHGQVWYSDDHPRFVNYQKRDKAKASDNASTVDRRRIDMELCLILDIDIDRIESNERVKTFFKSDEFEKTLMLSTFKKGYIESEARGRHIRIRVDESITEAMAKVSRTWRIITPHSIENPQDSTIDIEYAIDDAWMHGSFPTLIGGLQIHDYQQQVRDWNAVAIEHLIGWICTKPLGMVCPKNTSYGDDSLFMFEPDTRTVLDENSNEQRCFLLIPYNP